MNLSSPFSKFAFRPGLRTLIKNKGFQKLFAHLSLLFIFTNSLLSCTHLFYHPTKVTYPIAKTNKVAYEVGQIQTEDGLALEYWYIPFEKNKHLVESETGKKLSQTKGLFLQFHGNAQNLSSHFGNLIWVLEFGYDLLVFDYRGYGKSEGEPSPEGLFKDAKAALEFADQRTSQLKEKNLIAYGQSLGGSVLLNALTEVKRPSHLKMIVVESSFYSYEKIAQEKLAASWMTWPFQWLAYPLVEEGFSPKLDKLPELSPTPVLLVYSESDPVVSIHHGHKIFKSLAEPKKFIQFTEPGHIHGMWVKNGAHRFELMKFLKGSSAKSVKK